MDGYRIEWTDKLLIGDETIDGQHRQLVERIARVPDRSQGEADVELLSDMLAYAEFHLTSEEAYMAQIGYPKLAEHRDEHKTLRRTLLAYKARFDEGHRDLYALKQFLFNWVRDHVMDRDRDIGEFVRSLSPPNGRPRR